MTDKNNRIVDIENQCSPQVAESMRKLAMVFVDQIQRDIELGKLDLNKSSKKELA